MRWEKCKVKVSLQSSVFTPVSLLSVEDSLDEDTKFISICITIKF